MAQSFGSHHCVLLILTWLPVVIYLLQVRVWTGQHQHQHHWCREEEKCIFTGTKPCVMSLLPADIPVDFISEAACANSHRAEALQMSTLLIALHYKVKLWPPSAPQTWQPVDLISVSRRRFFVKLRDFAWLQFRKLHHAECSWEAVQVQLLSELNVLNTEQPQEACADKAQSCQSWTCTTVAYTKVCYRRQNIG